PACAEFQLVGRFFFNSIIDIHGTIVGIGNRIDAYFFLVKITEVGYFTLGADEFLTAELFARQGSQFSAYYMLLGFVVTGNGNPFYGSLRTFGDPYFVVNGIVIN